MRKNALSVAILAAMPVLSLAETLEPVSVTATKSERAISDVPQAVTLIDSEELETRAVRHINDALKGVPGVTAISKNGGYDSRLIIRGAGLKAAYGVREIMVLRDGVPMTDPDSFTRFDFVDVDDMQSVEVFKGPGSIEAANASGGVISIRSRSVFDLKADGLKVGVGSFGAKRARVRKSWDVGADDAVALSVSHRRSDNDWREWNDFDTTQASLKWGHFFADDSVLETELSYTAANMQLPASLDDDGFAYYLATGKTRNQPSDTGSAFVKNGRYSHILFFNSRYETRWGAWSIKPRIYANAWDHTHPVTGAINVKEDHVLGVDIPFERSNTLFGKKGQLVWGVTARLDKSDKSEKYKYRDYTQTTGWSGTKISEVLSDSKGDLIEKEDSEATLVGAYLQQHLALTPKLSMDVGVRFDRVGFDVSGIQWEKYDYTAGNYVSGIGAYQYRERYDLVSPKLSLLYKLLPGVNAWVSVSQAQQAPTDNEIAANHNYGVNTNLKASTATQYEIGTHVRRGKLSLDAAAYLIRVSDEIVQRTGDGNTRYYANAGETEKKGVELSAAYNLTSSWQIGGSWEGRDYRYVDFKEGRSDYSGNAVRFSPEQIWSLFAQWHKGPWQVRLSGRGMGRYHMDDANTETYAGYNMVSDLTVRWQQKHHSVQLNVTNLADLRYAEEAEAKHYGSRTVHSYTPGEPRAFQLTYRYQF